MCCKIKPFPPNGQKFCRFFSPFPHISRSAPVRRRAQSAAERARHGARKRVPSSMETMNEARGRAAQDERKNFRGDAAKAEQGAERRKRINAKNAFCAPKSNLQSKKARLMRSTTHHTGTPRSPDSRQKLRGQPHQAALTARVAPASIGQQRRGEKGKGKRRENKKP